MLAANPARLLALTEGVSTAVLHEPAQNGGWSPREVLAHLRSCADVWGDAIKTILAEEKPTIRKINPRTWIKRTDYRELEFAVSMRAFTLQRDELVAVLESLAAEGWARSATVKGAGKTSERSVYDYAHSLATHEQKHVQQLARAVA